jgi:exodeoxyribonuclease VII large subunit
VAPAQIDVGISVASGAVLPVSLLVGSARLILERHLGLVWVAGEISGFTRAASGHCYFNLKDASAQARCVFFRHKVQFVGFPLRDGLAVEVRATPSIYEARGEFQLNVETVRLAGVGALYEKFARLKARLEGAGFFAPERKRALPAFPRAVGIVTSTRAAALRDMLTTLARRWPSLRVVVYPTAVQGSSAAAEIAQAIRTANERAEVDVLVVGRGGGSIEDLWAFNEEAVAVAIFGSRIPVVSGVGHETDFTICDFVADVRAATPTAAAAMVAPDRRAVLASVTACREQWCRAGERGLEARMQRVDGLARRLVHPAARLTQQRRDAAMLAHRLARAFTHALASSTITVDHLGRRFAWQLQQPPAQRTRIASIQANFVRAGRAPIERAGVRVAALEQSLAHLNPRAVLDRGYAIVSTAAGAIVRDAAQLVVGDAVTLALSRGTAEAKIEKIEP